MSTVRELAAVVREALVNYGTWRMQKPRREKALAALDALVAECEERTKEIVRRDVKLKQAEVALEEMRRERDAANALLSGLTNEADANEAWKALILRAEAAERRLAWYEGLQGDANDADFAAIVRDEDGLEARARRYEEALLEVDRVAGEGRIGDIARAALSEEQNTVGGGQAGC